MILQKVGDMWTLRYDDDPQWKFVGFIDKVSARIEEDKVIIESPGYPQCPQRTIPADTLFMIFPSKDGIKLSDIMEEGIVYDFFLSPTSQRTPASVK